MPFTLAIAISLLHYADAPELLRHTFSFHYAFAMMIFRRRITPRASRYAIIRLRDAYACLRCRRRCRVLRLIRQPLAIEIRYADDAATFAADARRTNAASIAIEPCHAAEPAPMLRHVAAMPILPCRCCHYFDADAAASPLMPPDAAMPPCRRRISIHRHFTPYDAAISMPILFAFRCRRHCCFTWSSRHARYALTRRSTAEYGAVAMREAPRVRDDARSAIRQRVCA